MGGRSNTFHRSAENNSSIVFRKQEKTVAGTALLRAAVFPLSIKGWRYVGVRLEMLANWEYYKNQVLQGKWSMLTKSYTHGGISITLPRNADNGTIVKDVPVLSHT